MYLRLLDMGHNFKLNWATSGHILFFTPFIVTLILAYIALFPEGHIIYTINTLQILRPVCASVMFGWIIWAIFADPIPKWLKQLNRHYDQEPLKDLIKKHLYHRCYVIIKASKLFLANDANERITIYIQDSSKSFLRFFRFSYNEIQKNADSKSLPYVSGSDIIGTCFTNKKCIYHDFTSAKTPSQWVKANRGIYQNMPVAKLHSIKMKSKIYYAEQFFCGDEKIGVIVFETENSNFKKVGTFKQIQQFRIKKKCKTIFKQMTKEFNLYYKYVKIMKEVEGLENE